jgi:hypothetical protein
MNYKKKDEYYTQSCIPYEMIKQANTDLIGYHKREMAVRLMEMAIHKHTDKALLKYKFVEEDMTPDKLKYNGEFFEGISHLRIRATLEVYEGE